MANMHDKLRWQDSALCRKYDSELFFPDGEKGPNAVQIMQAKNVCSVCPVRYNCLADALNQGGQGIWGGTTERERRTIRQYLRDIPWQRAGAVGLAYVLGFEMPKCDTCGEHRRSTKKGMCYVCRSVRSETWTEPEETPQCSEEDCESDVRAKGLCSVHYHAAYAVANREAAAARSRKSRAKAKAKEAAA